MKRLILAVFTLALFALAACLPVPAQKTVPKPDVVVVGIGAKNPTFDESKYPHLTFVYTPGLVSQAQLGKTSRMALEAVAGDVVRDVMKGEPEILAQWWDEKDLDKHVVLLDASGVGAWEGWVGRRDTYMESSMSVRRMMMTKHVSLGEVYKDVVEKGKKAEVKAGKPFDVKDIDAVMNRKLPDFDVTTAAGEIRPISSWTENGKPTLVLFFRLPDYINMNAEADTMNPKVQPTSRLGALTSFAKGMVEHTMGSKYEAPFYNLEMEVFKYDAMPRR